MCIILKLCFFLHLRKAFAAIHRAVFARSERNLRLAAAGRADCDKHFPFGLGGVFTSVAADLAALGLIYETLGLIKLLFTGGENKFSATVFADDSFVYKH